MAYDDYSRQLQQQQEAQRQMQQQLQRMQEQQLEAQRQAQRIQEQQLAAQREAQRLRQQQIDSRALDLARDDRKREDDEYQRRRDDVRRDEEMRRQREEEVRRWISQTPSSFDASSPGPQAPVSHPTARSQSVPAASRAEAAAGRIVGAALVVGAAGALFRWLQKKLEDRAEAKPTDGEP